MYKMKADKDAKILRVQDQTDEIESDVKSVRPQLALRKEMVDQGWSDICEVFTVSLCALSL